MFTKNLFKQTLFGAMITAIAFSSCKKEGSIPAPIPPKPLQLTEYTIGSDVYKFAYDANGGLKTVTLGNDPLTGDDDVTYTLKYLANKKIEELTGSNGARIKLSYTNNLLTMAETFVGTEKIGVSNYAYTGTVLKTAEISFVHNNTAVPFYKADFVVNAAGNITRTNAYVYNPLTNAMEAGGHINLQYDSKVNPFVALGDIMLIFWQGATKNNVTKEEHFSSNGQAEEMLETTYIYNERGYPTRGTVTETQPGQQPATSILTFTYKQ